MKEFLFFDCSLEGRQLEFGESDFLAASEVVRYIFDAGFREHGLNTFDSGTNALFDCKYVMNPKDGMFLMEVRNHHGDVGKLVFIDTRTKPNFVWVQSADNGENDEWSLQVVHFVEDWISREAYAYGWKAKLKRSVFNKLVYWPQFDSAMAYVDGYLEKTPEFASYIVYEERTDEILKRLHLMLDKKVSAISIMRVIRAAIDVRLIEKPCYESFVMEFYKKRFVSSAAYKMYTNKKINPLADDKVYLEYVDKFLRLKDEWLDDIAEK